MSTKALSTDLNDDGPALKKEAKLVEPKFLGEEVILPIPSFDKNGNNSTVCKSLESTSPEEFLSWVKSVFPFNKEFIDRISGVKDGKGLETIKAKTAIFRALVELHEKRWLFGKGLANTETNN